jgi:hypothetical protein
MDVETVRVNIVCGLDENDFHDKFEIMQNKETFERCFFNCLIYLFSQHVNGFFEAGVLHAIVEDTTNLFASREEAGERALYMISLFDKFGFIKIKLINDKDFYVMSTIGAVGFSDCVMRANKFCKEFEGVLYGCLGVFKDWIVYSENKEADRRKDV